MAGNFSDWSPYTNYVQAGLVDGRYANAGFTMLAAGPPRLANIGGAAAIAGAVSGNPSAAATSGSYVIGPGDQLNVFVYDSPQLSMTVPVRPDGKVSTPLNEDMVAVGKTPSQLARDIETRLAEFVRSPTVNIIVSNLAVV